MKSATRVAPTAPCQMATAGSLNSLLKTPPLPPATAIRRSPPPASVFPAERCSSRAISVNYGALRPQLAATRREIRARASTYDDESRPETSGAGIAVAEKCEKTEIEELKGNLKELLYGSERGLRASSETRAEIVEVITQLEARNPYPAPTESLSLLNGKWILKYTSFSGLFPLLAMQRVPQLVKVDEITQTIDSGTFTCQNSVQFSGPLATTSVSTEAKFEIRSPKRVQIKFEQGIISTPQLTDSIVLPEKVEIFGQSVDLSPFKGVLGSIQDAASSIVKSISEQPPLKLPISGSNAESWLLTTYLDDELRISRGDRGSVFVMIRERCADSWIN